MLNDLDFEFESVLDVKKVVIQVQKRNARQCFTVISDLADDLDLKKICAYLQKSLKCGGNVIKDDDGEKIIRLTGDQKAAVINFLLDQEIYKKDEIIIKGV
jgi:translation initiation factor SUI1